MKTNTENIEVTLLDFRIMEIEIKKQQGNFLQASAYNTLHIEYITTAFRSLLVKMKNKKENILDTMETEDILYEDMQLVVINQLLGAENQSKLLYTILVLRIILQGIYTPKEENFQRQLK